MNLLKVLSLTVSSVLLISCDGVDDLIHMFDKERNDAYITNETDCDVTIRRKYYYRSEDTPGDSLYSIPAGKELEIPITDHWSLSLHTFEYDTVWFSFSDGSSYIHTVHAMHDIHGWDSIVYEPKDYNIFKINNLSTKPEDNCWTRSKIKGHHYRYDFYVTRK